ncbi:hypothetical protein QVD99_001051 [Batrachochytrium dendrobatidis]|nr:hypothetical protein QVD99_002744 [Batrachochytrium dendrobatidis]KAK5673614.1 hypothetical protein QVD99_001051 [Batrachochytrium dendrobatidis]
MFVQLATNSLIMSSHTPARTDSIDHLLDMEPGHDAQTELEFQNFVLSSAEADLIAGKVVKSPMPARSSHQAERDNFGFSNPPGPSMNSQGLPSNMPKNIQPSTNQISEQQPVATTSAFWTFEYWMQYFQVDSVDVGNRIITTIMPMKSFMELIDQNPDFYGPFWVPTTVIFTLFATSTMAESIAKAWSNQKYEYDMTMLSFAGAVVYTYVLLLPALLWGIAKYFGIATIRLFDMINVYGYGIAIWVPVSLLCIIQSDLIRWIIVLAAFALSTFFFIKNIQPLATDARAISMIFILVIGSQVALALVFKTQFFQHTIQIAPS